MNAPATEQEDFSYLAPLFKAAVAYRGDDHFLLLPDVAEQSSLAKDDEPLGTRGAAKFVQSSFSAGLMHVEAFAQLVTVAQRVDLHSPWTLLRGALENFATAAWLLAGKNPDERRHRVLSLWAEDFRNRAQHERDTNYVPRPGGKSGAERREEVKQLARNLGLPSLTKPETTTIIYEAAASAGLDSTATQALWRVASGFAHGRFWPNLRATKVRSAMPLSNGGALVDFVLDDYQLAEMAEACRELLEHTASRYKARSSAR
ncbi:hypothetical protein M2160_004500 [Streptomyces sp. SAI-117]|uniref:hypothetical protein n=1 Tax=Streptomyces sp. SAI-117 TaxID=2940546 RepID=UPI002474DE42|nr:hypothetical protein [Streptomyces sp. SAI-117]MDH6569479.1 hypothetical protein [Streptomyces sp. SAI-117]